MSKLNEYQQRIYDSKASVTIALADRDQGTTYAFATKIAEKALVLNQNCTVVTPSWSQSKWTADMLFDRLCEICPSPNVKHSVSEGCIRFKDTGSVIRFFTDDIFRMKGHRIDNLFVENSHLISEETLDQCIHNARLGNQMFFSADPDESGWRNPVCEKGKFIGFGAYSWDSRFVDWGGDHTKTVVDAGEYRSHVNVVKSASKVNNKIPSFYDRKRPFDIMY